MRGQDAAARLGKLKPARVDAALRECQGRSVQHRGPAFRFVVDERTRFDERLRAGEVRLECLTREWPARMGKPGTRLEIDRLEGAAPAAPMVRTAAEEPEPGTVQRKVRNALLAAEIKTLGEGIEVCPTALEDDH